MQRAFIDELKIIERNLGLSGIRVFFFQCAHVNMFSYRKRKYVITFGADTLSIQNGILAGKIIVYGNELLNWIQYEKNRRFMNDILILS